MTDPTTTRDRVADLNTLADHILRGLYTWNLPADLGVDYGFRMGRMDGAPRGHARSYSSAEEILSEVLGIPNTDSEDAEETEAVLLDYAHALWRDVGDVLRARGGPLPAPPKRERPPWADMKSADGVVVLTVPDELIPFVDPAPTDEERRTMQAAFWTVASLSGAMAAYDARRLGAQQILAQFELCLALWTERRKVHLLTGGRGVSNG